LVDRCVAAGLVPQLLTVSHPATTLKLEKPRQKYPLG
jgi:hypothetical protein